MIQVHFVESELELHGLEALPLVSIMLLLLNILLGITLGGQNLSGRLRCLGFWLKDNGKYW
jgi:hypothetical protein